MKQALRTLYLRLLVVSLVAFLLLTAFMFIGDVDPAHRLIVLVVTFILGLFPGMNLLQVVKNLLNVQDAVAVLVVYAVSGILAVVALAVTGVVGVADLTLENVIVIGNIVFSAATLSYRLFMKREPLGPSG